MSAPITSALSPGFLVLLAVALAVAGCGDRGESGDAADGGSPVGRWKYAPEILAAELEKVHADEGPAVVAQQKALAHDSGLEIEIRADGIYRLAVLSLGTEQRVAGHWKQDGTRLLFTPRKIDGETVMSAPIEEARFKDGRIEIDFDRKTFTLVRM